MMEPLSSKTTARTALILAGVAILGLVFITLFYMVSGGSGGPFGTLNDICVALGGILSGVLAWRLYPAQRAYTPRLSRLALVSGLLGAIIAPIGSIMAIFDMSGWFLAGLVGTLGYALIGLWLLSLNYALHGRLELPKSLTLLGMAAGVLMMVGFLALPGVAARMDLPETAPWFVATALYVGGFGWNILYAIWCIWFGRHFLAQGSTHSSPTAAKSV